MTDSQPSTPSLNESSKADKVGLAMLLRRAQQSQEADQVVLDHNRRYRENQARLMEARMERFGAKGAGEQRGDDVGDILIDSPQHHHYPQPPQRSSWLTTAIVGGLALLAGAGGPAIAKQLLGLFASRESVQRIENTEGFILRFPDAPKK